MVTTGILFGGFFGLVFIVIGFRRLMQAFRGPDIVDSVVWGVVGIALGTGLILLFVWFMRPMTPEERRGYRPYDRSPHLPSGVE